MENFKIFNVADTHSLALGVYGTNNDILNIKD